MYIHRSHHSVYLVTISMTNGFDLLIIACLQTIYTNYVYLCKKLGGTQLQFKSELAQYIHTMSLEAS